MYAQMYIITLDSAILSFLPPIFVTLSVFIKHSTFLRKIESRPTISAWMIYQLQIEDPQKSIFTELFINWITVALKKNQTFCTLATTKRYNTRHLKGALTRSNSDLWKSGFATNVNLGEIICLTKWLITNVKVCCNLQNSDWAFSGINTLSFDKYLASCLCCSSFG